MKVPYFELYQELYAVLCPLNFSLKSTNTLSKLHAQEEILDETDEYVDVHNK